MTIAVAAFFQLLDQYGKPVSGGRVYTYAAGTLTPLASYTDQSGTVPNPNPVILDGAGRAQIWLTANVPYKLVGTDSTGAAIPNATTDNYYAGASPEQLVLAGIVPAAGGTYTGLVNFNGGAVFGGTAAQDLATLDSLSIAGVQPANLWVNPEGAINQRLATTAADGAPGFDRSIVLCESGSVTLSQIAQPFDGAGYAMRMLQPDAGAKRIGAVQICEARDVLSYRGKNLAFAARVRCSAAVTVRCALVAWTGAIDAPTKDVVNTWSSTNYTASNFFVANTLPIAVGAAVVSANTWTDLFVSSTSAGGVVVPSTLNNLYMVYWSDSQLAQNVTLDATQLRCSQGTVAPLYLPPKTVDELLRCQRDFAKSYTQTIALGASNVVGADQAYGVIGGSISTKVNLPVTMRSIPTVSLWSTVGVASQWLAFSVGGVANPYAVTAGNIGDRGFTVSVTPASGEILGMGHWAASTGF